LWNTDLSADHLATTDSFLQPLHEQPLVSDVFRLQSIQFSSVTSWKARAFAVAWNSFFSADGLAFPVAVCGGERKTFGWKGKTEALLTAYSSCTFEVSDSALCSATCVLFLSGSAAGKGKHSGGKARRWRCECVGFSVMSVHADENISAWRAWSYACGLAGSRWIYQRHGGRTFLKLTSVISGGNFEIGDSDATRNGSFGDTAGYAA
jgi:hypothetical protein